MGQYFRPVIINEENTTVLASYDAHSFECGNKIFEHSWINNELVNAIESLFMKGKSHYKHRLVWAGDYADEIPLTFTNLYGIGKECESINLRKLNDSKRQEKLAQINKKYNLKYEKLFPITYPYSEEVTKLRKKHNDEINAFNEKFEKLKLTELPKPQKATNFSKAIYIINHSKGLYVDKTKLVTDKDGWCMHPLPYLTADSCGYSDYSGVDKEIVGTWKGDIISVESKYPKSFKELVVRFSE